MQFLFQALTAGFLLTLVPLLIHLINMMRHKRVKWAAMDFLLASYKKHRRWVWLKQLLLLLSRMAAIALIVAMLAQWDPRGSWLQSLGGKTTHHYVLLDDSYSMGERSGAGSVFETALKVVARIGAEAADQRSPQRFTLIRFSRAAVPVGDEAADDIADMTSEVVDGEFSSRLEETQQSMEPSQLSAGPRPAMEVLKQLLEEGRNEKNVAYVISDFRANPWDKPAGVRDLMQEVEGLETKLHLISAAQEAPATNLTLEEIQPDGSTRAAGVPLFINVLIRNQGSATATKVQVSARVRTCDAGDEERATPGEFTGEVEELSAELIDSIPGGAVGVARFQVAFPSVGRHVFEAQLPEDIVAADNQRWAVLEIESGEPVLAVEDRPEDGNAMFLMKILQPGGQANTGLRPELQPSAYLRDTPQEQLARYTAIYLFGANQLDSQMVQKLEAYVAGGGGLGVFMGPGVNKDQYNQLLHKDGEGLLPIPLGRDWLLSPPLDEGVPDVDISGTNHLVFRDLLRGRNPIIRMVKVDRYIEPAVGWTAENQTDVDVLARLHNGQPLAAEKRYQNGRVFQFMSSYAPSWNDLALGPNVLMTLNLQAHLAATRRMSDSRRVGSPLRLRFSGEQYESEVQFTAPAGKTRVSVQRQGRPADDESGLLEADLIGETGRSGIYEAWLQDLDGRQSTRRYAFNVDPAEGQLQLVDPPEMLAALEPASPSFDYAGDVYGIVDEAGFNPSLWIMGLLIVLLLGEQLLAYMLSYHPARQGDAR